MSCYVDVSGSIWYYEMNVMRNYIQKRKIMNAWIDGFEYIICN